MAIICKKKFIQVLILMFVLSLSVIQASAQVSMDKITNIMINSDFEEMGTWGETENNRKYGWYAQGDNTNAFNIMETSSSKPAQHGNYYATTWGKGYELYQYVPVEKNKVYVVSFWYKCMPSSGTTSTNYPLFEVHGADNTTVLTSKTYSTKYEWTQIVMCFNSVDNEKVRVRITNKGDGGRVAVDNYVMGICEPSTDAVCIDGYASADNVLNVVADVIDPIGDKVLKSEYQWQISNNGSGPWSDIETADDDKYTVKKSDEGKYIRVRVVPRSEAANGIVKKGNAVYSRALKVSAGTDYQPIFLKEYFTGKLLGTVEEAQEISNATDSINGYILNRDNVINALSESNVYMCSDVPYSMSLYSEKRAVMSDEEDIILSLGSQYLDSVNVLMTYSQIPTVDQNAIISYADGTFENLTYTAGSIMEKTVGAPLSNQTPMGMIGVGGNINDENAGFLYSYTFNLSEEKEAESITFPHTLTEGKLLIFAITGKTVSGEVLRQIIVDKIQELPETLTLNDRSTVENILSCAERYKNDGGNPDEISGYSVLKTLLTDVESQTTTSDLLDCTIDIDFSNPVKIDTISKDTITIAGLNENQYEVEPVMNGENVVGAKVIVINNFSYRQLEITLSDKIANAFGPHFSLGQAYKITYTPEKLFEVKNKECTLNGTSLRLKADLKNNSSQVLNYYFICAVYSSESEMLYAFENSNSLNVGGTANINEQLTVPATAATAKLFVWNGADTMNTIYQ